MKLVYALVALFILTIAGAFVLYRAQDRTIPIVDEYGIPQPPIDERSTLLINGREIPVEVARTAEEQRRGLSFRSSLPENEGMYFPFPVPEPLSFWMVGMKFPLDIIFIRDGIVLNIHANVLPPESALALPTTVNSTGHANAVLELNAGKSAEWGINEGMEVTVRPN